MRLNEIRAGLSTKFHRCAARCYVGLIISSTKGGLNLNSVCGLRQAPHQIKLLVLCEPFAHRRRGECNWMLGADNWREETTRVVLYGLLTVRSPVDGPRFLHSHTEPAFHIVKGVETCRMCRVFIDNICLIVRSACHFILGGTFLLGSTI